MAAVITMYDLLDRKRKSNILKSIYIKSDRTFEGYPIIEVEASDDAFITATSTLSKQNKVHDYIIKSIFDNADKIRNYLSINDTEFWLKDYSTYDLHSENLLDTVSKIIY